MPDIREEIEHHQKMITILRRRYRDREIQAAQYGIDVPPHITSEIELLEQKLASQERELNRLQQLLNDADPVLSRLSQKQSFWSKRYQYFAIATVTGILATFLTTIVILSIRSALSESEIKQNGTPIVKASTLPLQPLSNAESYNNNEAIFDGTWVGILTVTDTFSYSLLLQQDVNSVEGTSHSFRISNPQNYAVAKIKGLIKNDTITIEETNIIEENPTKSSCLLRFNLKYAIDGSSTYMRGSWEDISHIEGCPKSGIIEFKKQ